MDFALFTHVASLFFTPGNLLVIMLAAGVTLLFLGLPRVGRTTLALVAASCVIIAIFPVGSWLARPLEDAYPRPPLPDRVAGILVLSGGPDGPITQLNQGPELSEGRILTAADLSRRYPSAMLVYSGGDAPLSTGAAKDRQTAAKVFDQVSVPLSRIIWEEQARNTWENFVFSRALARPRRGDNWILVTSAIHMTRAMGVADKLCWPMIPWAADYVGTDGGGLDFSDHLSVAEMGVHEWVGLFVYWVTNRLSRKACAAPAPRG